MKIIDYIFLWRPMLIIPVWTIALLGARAATWRTRGINPFQFDYFSFSESTLSESNILLIFLLATLLYGGGFVFNQIFDVESDRRNNKLFLLPQGYISITEAWIVYAIVTVLSVAGAFFLNWQLGVLFVYLALLGVHYSHPRFKVHENPYKGMRNNMLGHGLVPFLIGWLIFSNFNIEGILKSVPYMLAVGAVYLNTTLPDIGGDREAGKLTYGIVWGVRKTVNRALYMVVASVILSIMAADYSFTIAAIVSLPFFLKARLSASIADAILASKIAILTLSLLAALYFPPYLLIVAVTIIICRIYYARRFDTKYPILMEEKR